MRRPSLLIITVLLSCIAVAAAAGATAIGVTALEHSTRASERAETAANEATEALAEVKAGQKASLVSRHITIKQRCDLTEHVGLHFPSDPWFPASHTECEEQLAKVIVELARGS